MLRKDKLAARICWFLEKWKLLWIVEYLVHKYHTCPKRDVQVFCDNAPPINMIVGDKCEVDWKCKIEFCSSEQEVKVFDLKSGQWLQIATLKTGDEHLLEHHMDVIYEDRSATGLLVAG